MGFHTAAVCRWAIIMSGIIILIIPVQQQQRKPIFPLIRCMWIILPPALLLISICGMFHPVRRQCHGGEIGAYGSGGTPPATGRTYSDTPTTAGSLTGNERWSGTVTLTANMTVPKPYIQQIHCFANDRL